MGNEIQINKGKFRKILDDFSGGYNLALDPSKIADNEFQQFENAISFKHGSIKNAVKRKGIDKYNSNTLSGTTNLEQLYEYISNSKSTNFTRLIAKFNNKLGYCVGTGTFTEIDGSDVTDKSRFLTFRDNLYIFGRNSSGTYYPNKFYDGTNYLNSGLIPCPQTFLCAETDELEATRELALGNYFYIITFLYDTDIEQESYYVAVSNHNSLSDNQIIGNTFTSETHSAFVWGEITAGNKIITISNIPTGNARVVARKIYRAYQSSGLDLSTNFYHIATLNNNTDTVFYDDIQTSELKEPINLDFLPKPLKAKYGIIHKNRIFIANLFEDLYSDQPDITTLANVSATGGGLTIDSTSARYNKYAYQFANLYLIPSFSVYYGMPYQGYIGQKTTAFASGTEFEATDPSHCKNTLSNIVNNHDYCKRTIIFRTLCQFIKSITSAGGDEIDIEIDNATGASLFIANETIKISGCSGTGVPDGEYTIISVDSGANTIRIESPDFVSHTVDTGRIEGRTFYYIGFTALSGTTYFDITSDSVARSNNYILETNNFQTLTKINTLPSTIQWSENGEGDKFYADNSIEIDQDDNDVITGLSEEDDGILIFKERNIYKLYTNTATWEAVKIVNGIGCDQPYSIIKVYIDNSPVHLFMLNNIIYALSGRTVFRISDRVQSILDSLTLTNIDVEFDRKRNWIIWTLSTSIIKGNVLVLDLNFRNEGELGKWYYWTANGVNYLNLRTPLFTKAGLLLFASDLNYIHNYSTSSNQDTLGSNTVQINFNITTRMFDYDYATIKAVLMKLKCNGTVNLTVNIITDDTVLPTTLSLTNDYYLRKRINCNMKFKEMALQLTQTANAILEIKELGFEYTPEHITAGGLNG